MIYVTKKLLLLALATTLFHGMVPSTTYAGGGKGSGGSNAPRETRLEGTLVSTNLLASQAVVRIQGGRLVTVSVPASIKIERNGVRATLAAFKAGDRVQARFLNNATTKFEGVGR